MHNSTTPGERTQSQLESNTTLPLALWQPPPVVHVLYVNGGGWLSFCDPGCWAATCQLLVVSATVADNVAATNFMVDCLVGRLVEERNEQHVGLGLERTKLSRQKSTHGRLMAVSASSHFCASARCRRYRTTTDQPTNQPTKNKQTTNALGCSFVRSVGQLSRSAYSLKLMCCWSASVPRTCAYHHMHV